MHVKKCHFGNFSESAAIPQKWLTGFFFSFVFKPLHTEMRFASFISGGFIIDIVVNQPERKLTKTHLFALSEVAGL